jgi:hypothetical protein
VFFSPNQYPDALNIGLQIADHEYPEPDWRASNCNPDSAANLVSALESRVETLAGWSLARLAPIYVLTAAPRVIREHVHRIILFDPGDEKDFRESCESSPNINANAQIVHWLGMNPANRLLVLTGAASEEKTAGPTGHAVYGGLWHYYFAGVWNTSLAARVQVCDYDQLDHKYLMHDFAWVVNNPPQTPCPNVPWDPPPTPWNP